MRVLVVHNSYQHRGGEDSVVEAEVALLCANGHEVRMYLRHNDEIAGRQRLSLLLETMWSRGTFIELSSLIDKWRPDVVHVHNTLPIISPSVFWLCGRLGIPVVQTLHNFRLMCPQAMFLRDGRPCEDCLGKLPWRGVVRGCYRGSVSQTGVLAAMVSAHRIAGTWHRKVSRYIALSEFSRRKFVAGGLPADRIVVKPNFVDFPAFATRPRNGFLFVGRLSGEKGISTLVSAARLEPGLCVCVAGDGPSAHLLEGQDNVSRLGILSTEEIVDRMCSASALVLPSICYENFPRTLVEAFACGLPVIASRLGVMEELIEDGVTGILFDPGCPADLAAKMRWASDNPVALSRMGRAARNRYEARFSGKMNHKQLIEIYQDVIDEVNSGRDRRNTSRLSESDV